MSIAIRATPHFQHEYQEEMERWFRRRFRFLCIAYLAFEIIGLGVLAGFVGISPARPTLVALIAAAASIVVLVCFLLTRRWIDSEREHVLRLATTMILILGSISLMGQFVVYTAFDQHDVNMLGSLLFWHLSACLFLPWTPRESLRPILPLLAAWAVLSIIIEWRAGQDASMFLAILLSPLILLPGLAICAARLRRHGRKFRSRMIGKHYLSMRQELERARDIHESIFPQPFDDGHIRFDYTYHPMKEIGGDYLHCTVTEEGLFHTTLLDVTGHGLAAALTVNRLFGELERIRAELPHAGPADVLTLLNRYFALTLTRHSIYATAFSLTADPTRGIVYWANAGHPPGHMRSVNGPIRDLPSSAPLLGALDTHEYEIEQQSLSLAPGDVVVLYTDGAFEARNRAGQQFGLRRIRDLMTLKSPPRNWPQFIAATIDKHVSGAPEDDILIASITFQSPRVAPLRQADPVADAHSR